MIRKTIAVLYKNSLFIVFGADNIGSLRNDFFVIDITNWQWVTEFKMDGNYPTVVKPTETGSTSITSTNINSDDKTSFANNQICFMYMKTVYLMIGVMIVFTFM